MAKKIGIPWELKYKFTLGAWTSHFKGVLYAIREKYGAAAALEIFERVWKMDDRVKNMSNTLKTVFNLEGNDAETMANWWAIWSELVGQEGTILERSKTMSNIKVTKCPFKTEPKDISGWELTFTTIAYKTINPKVTVERPKAMCAGDPYCEWIIKCPE